MWTKMQLVGLTVGLFGCGAIVDPLVDDQFDVANSPGGRTAEIAGSKKGALERETCHIVRPTPAAMLLVTDAGPVSVTVGCEVPNTVVGDREGYRYAAVEFIAEAGHKYRFSRTSSNVRGFTGVDVIDVTDNRRLVARRPIVRRFGDAVGSGSLAYVFSMFDTDGAGETRCQMDGTSYRRFVVPGEVSFTVRCTEWGSSFGSVNSKIKAAYEAELNFEAQLGHSYAVSFQNEGANCIQLTDVTADPLRPLFCQPTAALDEHLGQT